MKNLMGGNGGQGGNWKCGGGNGEWKKNRALAVAIPPEVFQCNPGQTVMVEIIMKNNTHWPWKEGFTLQSVFDGKDPYPLEKLVLPIDFFVDKMSTFNMLIPVKVKCGAIADGKEYAAQYNFVNRRGTTFGETIEIKFKVVQPIDEVEFYQIAMDMFENQHLAICASFDKIVDVLKKFNGDRAKAMEQLEHDAKAEEEENQMYI